MHDTDSYMPHPQGLYDPAFEKDSCGVGFIVNIKGYKSNKTVTEGLKILDRLTHRGATGADPLTGDGAGILMQMPHEFMEKAATDAGYKLPAEGDYGAGLVFMPPDKSDAIYVREVLEKAIREKGQKFIGYRSVPVDSGVLGYIAREKQPVFEHVFIGRGPMTTPGEDFERQLFLIRKTAENTIRASSIKQKFYFYITNLSSKTLIYKGLMLPGRTADFFTDLKSPLIKSALCLVHSRYSTNTFPSWDLAQPFRCVAHNGEINTLRANINWLKAREGMFESAVFGADIKSLKPAIRDEVQSDSATLDNAFELLTMT
ncbi:MAG: glutamate synthase subunit alpha, partial [Spirochaetia bacterium]|nr:glutamate synthase subunit alpha [Spirochaetia bacterium]